MVHDFCLWVLQFFGSFKKDGLQKYNKLLLIKK